MPADAADQRLRSHVHPPDWINPEPRGRYHLVVIGGGTAGLVSAMGAAGLGARVALIERDLLGGDCLVVNANRKQGRDRAGHGHRRRHQDRGTAAA